MLVGRFLGSPQISFRYENGKLNANLFILFSEDTHETPLHMCVQRHDSKFTKLLVKANADLYIRDNSGDRPIDIKQENEDVTNTLKAAMFEKDRVEKAKTSSS